MKKVVVFGVIAAFLLLGCHPTEKKTEAVTKKSTPDAKNVAQKDTLAAPTYDEFGIKIDSLVVDQHKVRRNESLYLILDDYDFSPQEIYQVTQRARGFVDLKSLKPGQDYRIYSSADSGKIQKMVWQQNPLDFVVFDWQDDSLQISKAARPLTTKTAMAAGTIDNSLYQTVTANDASPLLAYKMAEVFAWQINFFGLRSGDSFEVVYNKQYIDGNYYGIGEILAAKFTHRGETYEAYRFQHEAMDGYFTETGKSVQKALLKAPFKFSQRISSRFSHNRLHPILKRRMPHYGVDYAAPYGTPVLSVGDGTVTEAQYRGANGNIVKITHNSTYRTAYLHLRGFASGIHPGAKVEQGQVIGYVGNTGRSTGAHLDYRLYKNDHPVNPLTVDLPSSESIPDSLMDEFAVVRDSLMQQLNNIPEDTGDDDLATRYAR